MGRLVYGKTVIAEKIRDATPTYFLQTARERNQIVNLPQNYLFVQLLSLIVLQKA
jgi:hypothetical protein